MMIPDVRKDTLLPISRQKVVPDSIVYTELFHPAYDVLDVSEFHLTTGSTTQTPMFSIATLTSTRSRTSGTRAKRTLGSIQRHSESPLSALFQGDRVSLQLWKTQPAIANSQTLGQTQALANRSGTAPKNNKGVWVGASSLVRRRCADPPRLPSQRNRGADEQCADHAGHHTHVIRPNSLRHAISLGKNASAAQARGCAEDGVRQKG